MRFRDRVKDTTTTTGTGTITLSGTAPTGFDAFGSAFSVGESFMYVIVGGAEWETGIGTLATSTTFTRDTVFESSNGDALVNFSAGTKDVAVTAPGALVEDIYNWVTMTGRTYV